MKIINILTLLALSIGLMNCGHMDNDTYSIKDIPDAEKGVRVPWFYIGEWHYQDATDKNQWAKLLFDWDTNGRLVVARKNFWNDNKFSTQSTGHSDTLEFLRDSVSYVNDNTLYDAKIDGMFVRVSPIQKTPSLFVNPDCGPEGALVGSCEYYSQCVEASFSCGEKGYPIAYGLKYCRKFSEFEFKLDETKAWVSSTRKCLHLALYESLLATPNKRDMGCEIIKSIAFDNHPNCYSKEPDSICYLNPKGGDLVKIGIPGFIIDPSNYFTIDSSVQVRRIAQICLEQLNRKFQVLEDEKDKIEIKELIEIWKSYDQN